VPVLQGDATGTFPDSMKRRLPAALLLACLAAALFVGVQPGAAKAPLPHPAGFFGIVPQTGLTPEDYRYMKAGGVESVRLPLAWSIIQPTRRSAYDWSSFDQVIETAARGGMRVLPSIGSPPRWAARKPTTMPIDNALQRRAWQAFLRAAVARYGPGGEFWRQHQTGGIGPSPVYQPELPVPNLPIKSWQIWNEANFFYFAFPVSPSRFAKLVTISSQAIKSVRPGAQVVLSGLFGEPTAGGRRGMPAAEFLRQFYEYPGIKNRFDAVSLHPYAVDAETLEEYVEEFHEVSVENHDRPGFYITEMGWGSQDDFEHDAFEQGSQGQVKQLRDSYEFLLANQRRLNLKQVYWFSWKDLKGLCDFCDSVGLFHEGPRFHPKPSWRAFVALTGGRVRP
jgi:Beta-galactosidase/Glycosyl hydrolase catalytic core